MWSSDLLVYSPSQIQNSNSKYQILIHRISDIVTIKPNQPTSNQYYLKLFDEMSMSMSTCSGSDQPVDPIQSEWRNQSWVMSHGGKMWQCHFTFDQRLFQRHSTFCQFWIGAGMSHIFDNITHDILKCLDNFPRFQDQLRTMVDLVSVDTYRSRPLGEI